MLLIADADGDTSLSGLAGPQSHFGRRPDLLAGREPERRSHGMKRRWWSVLVVLLVVVLASGTPALARKSGSSFSSGGKSRSSGWGSSTRSSGWGNSSTTPRSSGWGSTPTAPTTPKSSGWSNTPATPPSSSGWGNSSRPTPPSAPSPGRDRCGRPAAGAIPMARAPRLPGPNRSGPARPLPLGPVRHPEGSLAQGLQRLPRPLRQARKPRAPFGPDGPIPSPNRTWTTTGLPDQSGHVLCRTGLESPGLCLPEFFLLGIWDAMFLWFMLRQAAGRLHVQPSKRSRRENLSPGSGQAGGKRRRSQKATGRSRRQGGTDAP